ncbi:hypothetical protein PEL8287_03060 [Roseovarius litorisediminis]|uniref:Uncharacterized protein n=1 Tax=Roseovarius litorisediminis TaxID=1312363 RepID=A0A1Y5T660_9RHOB|nr:hypothetical protein PEL8287_03060 [Roseovarius litorisediminis]
MTVQGKAALCALVCIGACPNDTSNQSAHPFVFSWQKYLILQSPHMLRPAVSVFQISPSALNIAFTSASGRAP